MAPRFTIGIPTYNRASLLRRSLQAAVSQSVDGVEVLVSDNGSTDDTPKVAAEFGDRVRYLRHDQNRGTEFNFRQLVTQASAPYFSFLQDDDLLHRDWVKRALFAFSSRPNVKGYGAALVMTPSVSSWLMPVVYSPYVAMDWMGGALTYLDGKAVPPLAFFGSLALPPAVAFETEGLRKTLPFWTQKVANLIECLVLASTVMDGTLALDPWVGGVNYLHRTQRSEEVAPTAARTRAQEYQLMADFIDEMMKNVGDTWIAPFREILKGTALHYRQTWLQEMAQYRTQKIALQVTELLRESLEGAPEEPLPLRKPTFKDYARDLTPPLVWRSMKDIKKQRRG